MYAGNATIATILMRWPWLVVPAAAIGIIAVIPEPKPAEPAPAPPAIVVEVPKLVPLPPLVVKKVPPPPLEVLCPPVEKTVKLSKKEKKVLIDKGCKVKG